MVIACTWRAVLSLFPNRFFFFFFWEDKVVPYTGCCAFFPAAHYPCARWTLFFSRWCWWKCTCSKATPRDFASSVRYCVLCCSGLLFVAWKKVSYVFLCLCNQISATYTSDGQTWLTRLTCHISIMGVVGIVSCHSHCVYTQPHRHVNFQSFDQHNRSDSSDLVGLPSSKGLESYKVLILAAIWNEERKKKETELLKNGPLRKNYVVWWSADSELARTHKFGPLPSFSKGLYLHHVEKKKKSSVAVQKIHISPFHQSQRFWWNTQLRFKHETLSLHPWSGCYSLASTKHFLSFSAEAQSPPFFVGSSVHLWQLKKKTFFSKMTATDRSLEQNGEIHRYFWKSKIPKRERERDWPRKGGRDTETTPAFLTQWHTERNKVCVCACEIWIAPTAWHFFENRCLLLTVCVCMYVCVCLHMCRCACTQARTCIMALCTRGLQNWGLACTHHHWKMKVTLRHRRPNFIEKSLQNSHTSNQATHCTCGTKRLYSSVQLANLLSSMLLAVSPSPRVRQTTVSKRSHAHREISSQVLWDRRFWGRVTFSEPSARVQVKRRQLSGCDKTFAEVPSFWRDVFEPFIQRQATQSLINQIDNTSHPSELSAGTPRVDKQRLFAATCRERLLLLKLRAQATASKVANSLLSSESVITLYRQQIPRVSHIFRAGREGFHLEQKNIKKTWSPSSPNHRRFRLKPPFTL